MNNIHLLILSVCIFLPVTANACIVRYDPFVKYYRAVAYFDKRVYPGTDVNKLVKDILNWLFESLNFISTNDRNYLFIKWDTYEIETDCHNSGKWRHDYNCTAVIRYIVYALDNTQYVYFINSIRMNYALEDHRTGIITLRLAGDIEPTYDFDMKQLYYKDQLVYGDIIKGYYKIFTVIKYDVDRNRPLNAVGF